MNLLDGSAERQQAAGIFFRLHQKKRGRRKNTAQKRPEEKSYPGKATPIPSKRPLRKPAIHKHNGDLAAAGYTKKIRPNLRLENNHHRRAHGAKCAAYRETPVEREIENRCISAKALSGKLLARGRRRRENQAPVREAFFELTDQSQCGESLADGNGVDPDRAGLRVRPCMNKPWQLPESLGQIMKVLAAAQTLNQEIGGSQNRANGGHQTVEEIHESAAFPLTAVHHPVRPARTDRYRRLVYRTIRTAGDKTRYYRPVMRSYSRGLLFAAFPVLCGPPGGGQE